MRNHDEIRLLGIGGYGYHGVLSSERAEGQPFHVDLVLHVDTAEAARSDELHDTNDYSAVASAVVAVIEGEPVNLIETLAGRIADAVLEFEIAQVDVTVHKPRAPMGVPFTDVQVRITRSEPTGATPAVRPTEAQPSEGQPSAAEPTEPDLGDPLVAGLPAASVAPPVPPAGIPVPSLLDDNEGVPSQLADDADGELERIPENPVPIVLGIGGNLGDVRATLREAISDLDKTPGIDVQEVSALARTAPVTHDDAVAQSDYLNAIVLAQTTLSPRQLLVAIHAVEDAHGRVRVERWGDRTLDIDIITYAEVISEEPDLTLPHPRATLRAFVLVPWAQVDPAAQIPGESGGAVAALADAAPDRGGIRWLALDWLQDQPPAPTAPPAPPAAQTPAPPAASAPPAPPAAQTPAPPAAPMPAAPSAPVSQPGSGEPPAVEDWLSATPAEEPEHADVQPVLPVTPPPSMGPFPGPHGSTGGAGPHPGAETAQHGSEAAQPEGDPAASEGEAARSERGGVSGVDWLAPDPDDQPLPATPQWSKVRREE